MGRYFLILFALLTGFIAATAEERRSDNTAPDFALKNSYGQSISLSQFQGSTVVLEWTNHLCPYVQKYYRSGAMQRLQSQFTDDGVIWLSIISSAPGKQGHVTGDKANDLTARRGVYASHILLDPTGKVGRMYKAKTTPQMVLITPKGEIVYQGAIDNRPSAQLSSLKGARNYLLEAWKAVKAGKPVKQANTKPYGCSVKYADE